MKTLAFSFLLVLISFNSVAQEGDSLLVNKIIIEGNDKTKERIIKRELSLREGIRYSRAGLDSIFVWDRNNIYNTNLFNTVKLETTNESEGQVDIKITVEERWYFYPIPFLKLIDRNISDWWVNRDRDPSRVNYGIRLTQFNFRGKNELLRIILQTGFTSGYAIQYNIPNLDKSQNNGLYFTSSFSRARNVAFKTIRGVPRFTFDSEETLRKVRFNSIRHSYRSSYYTFHNTTLGHYSAQIADTLALLNENYLGEGRTTQNHFYFGHSFRYDKRDNINYTLKGTRISAGIFKHGLGIHNDGVNYWRARFKAAHHWDLKNNWYAASDVSILSTFPQRRDYFNYYQIGIIPETLRGYDLQIVEGSSYVIQRNELKYKLFQNSYNFLPIKQFQTFPLSIFVKAFYDHGYVKGYPNYDGSKPLSDSYLHGYGLGVDFIIINDVTIRVEFPVNSPSNRYFFVNFLSLI